MRPIATAVLNRELERAMAVGALSTFSYHERGTARELRRRWVLRVPGVDKELSYTAGQVEAFALGVLAGVEATR